MKNYEAIIVLKPQQEDLAEKVINTILDNIKKNKGEIISQDNWGKKPIAYPIKNNKEGIFYKLNFSLEPALIDDLKKNCSLNSEILRTMILRKD